MPDDVRSSLNHVIEYFMGDAENEMLNDSMSPGFDREVEEPEEKESFDASRQLEIMMNPLEHTNRFLRYEFMKERNGITQAGFQTDMSHTRCHTTCPTTCH